MADLIDRISGESEYQDPARPKINLHRLIGAERLYALGEWTGVQISTEFDFQGAELTQATQIKTAIDGAGNASNKMIYIGRVEGVMMCVEDNSDRLYHNADGSLNKTKVYEDLQIAG